ncbi:glycosyltransferase family 1 protein [Parathielavia appendiculata]|uniref:Glycosyltransferase family 1 protein n=1 Tax=Parathielavia appendiculata TaxID=2587402 RepID=A0AAN6TQG7_9PEZI|nr:glycosyltransferase family 1 protein [Parathielavia appendiculata]
MSDCTFAAARELTMPRKILVVVTAGGYTNAAPVLEIASVLASRGYSIDFATFSGREQWIKDCPFVSSFHVIGPSESADVEEANYIRMSSWTTNLMSNWAAVFETRMYLESSWPNAYRGLSRLMQDPATRPDFILADYWVDAARDMSVEYDIPLAMHWPQMPTAMLPAPYIPGTPGLQIEVLTSEFATLWQRLRSAVAIYTSLPHYLRYLRWRRGMRFTAGVTRPLPVLTKPEYLCLVNSFFGLEAAKDLPPNVAAIGPVLSEAPAEPLDETYERFLSRRRRVLYASLGTHVLLPATVMSQLLAGVLGALRSGAVDGVIWAIRPMARKQLDQAAQMAVPAFDPPRRNGGEDCCDGGAGAGADKTRIEGARWKPDMTMSMTVASLLANGHPSVLFVNHAPQRALLHDHRIAAFLSHAGPASANEAVYAGVPLVTVAVYFDQLQNAMRLRDTGVAIALNKDTLKADQVQDAIERLAEDLARGGPITASTERMQRIAHIAARRKHLAADLIEEVLVDWEGRRKEERAWLGNLTRGGRRYSPRGMHLQTADARMPWWKAKNWDLWAVGFAATFCLLGSLVALPVVLGLTL